MTIELTDEQRRLARQGQPVDVIDPQTNEVYVVVAKPNAPAAALEIPEGIRLSRAAFRRDLPQLLQDRRRRDQWVAYHRHERLGFSRRQHILTDDCLKRGLSEDDFYVGWIHPCELVDEEEIDPRPQHFE